ncbi:MAG: DUF6178 family protein [Myxococcota bacterium]
MPLSKRFMTNLSQNLNIGIVRKLPAQEALMAIKERGIVDSHELLELLSPSQVQEIFDLDAWNFDQVNIEKMEEWLENLFTANSAVAVKAFHELDIELIAFLLKTQTEIYHLEMGEDPIESPEQALYTPDGRYLVVFSGSTVWKYILEQLFARDLDFSLRLLESVRYETASGLEEEALHWRDGRLQDLGFSPLAELKSILQKVNPDMPLPPLPDNIIEGDESVQPGLLKLAASKGVFEKAYDALPEKDRPRVMREFIATCNQVHLAYGRDAGERQALTETITYVTLMIEKALEYRSIDALAKTSVKKLFQIGHSLK